MERNWVTKQQVTKGSFAEYYYILLNKMRWDQMKEKRKVLADNIEGSPKRILWIIVRNATEYTDQSILWNITRIAPQEKQKYDLWFNLCAPGFFYHVIILFWFNKISLFSFSLFFSSFNSIRIVNKHSRNGDGFLF